VKPALWAGVILLAVLGIWSALFRAAAIVHPGGAAARFERRLVRSLNNDDALIDRYDARFAAHPAVSIWHVLPGALFLALAPLQLSRRIRARHLRFHRWSGRLLVFIVIAATLDSFYFGILHPFAGIGEVSAIAVFGALMLVAVLRGFIAIRRGDESRHRRWMIRAVAIALGISTIRVVGALLQMLLPMPPAQMLTVSFWIGWTLTLAAAEVYLRASATSARTYSSTVRGTGSALPQP
jgi:uncharacterized membrane protein